MIRYKVSAPSTLSGPFPDILSDVFLFLRHGRGQNVRHLHLLPTRSSITYPSLSSFAPHGVNLKSLTLSLFPPRFDVVDTSTWSGLRSYGSTAKGLKKSDRYQGPRGTIRDLTLLLHCPWPVTTPPLSRYPNPSVDLEAAISRCIKFSTDHRHNVHAMVRPDANICCRVVLLPGAGDKWTTSAHRAATDLQTYLMTGVEELAPPTQYHTAPTSVAPVPSPSSAPSPVSQTPPPAAQPSPVPPSSPPSVPSLEPTQIDPVAILSSSTSALSI